MLRSEELANPGRHGEEQDSEKESSYNAKTTQANVVALFPGNVVYGIVTTTDPGFTVRLGETAWTVTETVEPPFTVTAAEAFVAPPGPLAVIVYVVELAGCTTVEP